MFHCNICGVSYVRHANLVRHELTTTSCRIGVPLGCPHCAKFFSCQLYLDYHQRNWHYIQYLHQVPNTRRKSLNKLDTNICDGAEVGEVIAVPGADRKLWFQPHYKEYERIVQIRSPDDDKTCVSVIVIHRPQPPRGPQSESCTPVTARSAQPLLSPSHMRKLSIHDNDGHVFRTIDLRNNRRELVHVPEFLEHVRSTVNVAVLDALVEHDQLKFNFDLHVDMATISDERWADGSMKVFTKSFATDFERFRRGDNLDTAVGKGQARLLGRISATLEAGTAICEIRTLQVNIAEGSEQRPPQKRIPMDLF